MHFPHYFLSQAFSFWRYFPSERRENWSQHIPHKEHNIKKKKCQVLSMCFFPTWEIKTIWLKIRLPSFLTESSLIIGTDYREPHDASTPSSCRHVWPALFTGGLGEDAINSKLYISPSGSLGSTACCLQHPYHSHLYTGEVFSFPPLSVPKVTKAYLGGLVHTHTKLMYSWY